MAFLPDTAKDFWGHTLIGKKVAITSAMAMAAGPLVVKGTLKDILKFQYRWYILLDQENGKNPIYVNIDHIFLIEEI